MTLVISSLVKIDLQPLFHESADNILVRITDAEVKKIKVAELKITVFKVDSMFGE